MNFYTGVPPTEVQSSNMPYRYNMSVNGGRNHVSPA